MASLGDILTYTYETKKGVSILFRGASGYGKTEIAKKCCNFIVGRDYQYCLGNNVEFDNNKLEITNWVNITDGELKDLMRVDVSVVIEAPPLPVDHGISEFNMKQILDNILSNN